MITKISCMDRLPYFLSYQAPLTRAVMNVLGELLTKDRRNASLAMF